MGLYSHYDGAHNHPVNRDCDSPGLFVGDRHLVSLDHRAAAHHNRVCAGVARTSD